MFQDCNLARASSCAELNAQPAHAPRPRRRGSRRYPGAGAEPLLVGGSPSLEGEARRARLANPVHSPVRNAASSVAISRSRWAILAIVARLTSAVWQRPGITPPTGSLGARSNLTWRCSSHCLRGPWSLGPGLSGRAFSGSSSGGHGPGPSPLLGCDRAVTSPEHGALASLEVARALRLECVDGGWGRVGRPAATADGAGYPDAQARPSSSGPGVGSMRAALTFSNCDSCVPICASMSCSACDQGVHRGLLLDAARHPVSVLARQLPAADRRPQFVQKAGAVDHQVVGDELSRKLRFRLRRTPESRLRARSRRTPHLFVETVDFACGTTDAADSGACDAIRGDSTALDRHCVRSLKEAARIEILGKSANF